MSEITLYKYVWEILLTRLERVFIFPILHQIQDGWAQIMRTATARHARAMQGIST